MKIHLSIPKIELKTVGDCDSSRIIKVLGDYGII
jgi:hypothetical protein